MTRISVEQTREGASMTQLAEDLWPLLEQAIRLAAKGKAASRVTAEFLGDARESVISAASNDALSFSVRSPGGMCAGLQAATEHWLYLATIWLAPRLEELLATHGFRFAAPRIQLEDALAKTTHAPLVVIKGVLHGIDSSGELFCDDALRVSAEELTKAQRELVHALHEARRCACPMCEALRKKVPALDVPKLRKQLASVRETTNIRTALARPLDVRVLDLHDRHDVVQALATVLPALKNLEALNLDGVPVHALPEGLASWMHLRSLSLSRTRVEALPALATLQRLHANWTDLRSLPRAMHTLQEVELGFRENPAVDAFLPVLQENLSLRALRLFGGSSQGRSSKTASPAAWVRGLQGFDFAKVALEELTLWNFPLTELPESLARCTGLKLLDVRGTPMRAIELDLRGAPLEHLVIEGAIERIPSWVGEIRTLRHLSLTGSFDTVPEGIFELTQLEGLGLNGKLRVLPKDIARLRSLKHVWLWGNPFASLPTELASLPALEMLGLFDVRNGKALVESIGLSPRVRVHV
jgi:hypothetical protein